MKVGTEHFLHSSARENVLEHLFIGELLRTLWCEGAYDVEVLRAEVDNRGYDLVIECNGVIRHVQLKSSYKLSRQSINAKIATKPGGCVVWVLFDRDNLSFRSFRWLGGSVGQPLTSLGEKKGKHTRANKRGVKAERPNIQIGRAHV